MMSLAATPQLSPRILNADDFNNLMNMCASWPSAPRFAVAVSGGPDSIALTFLLNEWVKQRGGSVLAITIDHQLRVESADEAAQVKTWCTQKNIPHETLRWEKETAPTSALHDQARNARYDLLIEACKKNNIDYLFLGHHADDQAETVLMRFMKGSGVDGLAAMPRLRDAQGVTLYRPLLPVSKQMLEDTCAAHGWAFVRDPSNQSLKYNRGRLRSLAAPLAAEGLTTATLYETARHAGIARAAFEIITNAWLRQHASVNLFGIITLDGTAWKKLDDEQKRRALIRALLTTSGEDYPPRNASLDTLIQNLSTHATINQTLSGCRIALQNETLHIYREEAALPTPMPLENNMLWDNRFKIICDPSLLDQDLVVAPLGNHSRNTLEKMHLKQVAEYPATQRAIMPAFYRNNALHSVPEFMTQNKSQALVKAIFLPRRALIIPPFSVCPPLYL